LGGANSLYDAGSFRAPVVALNQPLSVVASFGRARVQSAGVALSEGGVGDLVDVFVVSGRVLSSKLVVVQ